MIGVGLESLTVDFGTVIKALLLIAAILGGVYAQLLPIHRKLAAMKESVKHLQANMDELQKLHPRQS